jgi:lipopolysaccharide biosynthesis glycosyltransferase
MGDKLGDQDVLIVVCEGRTLYLPYQWNYIIDYTHTYSKLPEQLKRQYIEYGKNPSIIHFQPWTHVIETLYSHYFWDYASRTPFYAEIKMRKRKNFKKNIKKYFRHMANYLRLGGLKPLVLILKDMLSAKIRPT